MFFRKVPILHQTDFHTATIQNIQIMQTPVPHNTNYGEKT